MNTILHSIQNINIDGDLEFDKNLALHSSFKVGGPADILAWPMNEKDIHTLITWAEENEVPWQILGGGANVLISDKGIRGLVIATGKLNHTRFNDGLLIAGSGSDISDISAQAADSGRGGLDFIYAMPGSTGGAVWMNARCYGGEISEVLEWVDYLVPVETDEPGTTLEKRRLLGSDGGFEYKISPFQNQSCIILEAAFRLEPADTDQLWKRMREFEQDRTSKGHFRLPCAGSVFKNNRDFGAPSGKIIDSLGLRGTVRGGAKISDWHANIIVNTGDARARDIAELIDLMHAEVMEKLGFNLEAEVLKIGDWGHGDEQQ